MGPRPPALHGAGGKPLMYRYTLVIGVGPDGISGAGVDPFLELADRHQPLLTGSHHPDVRLDEAFEVVHRHG